MEDAKTPSPEVKRVRNALRSIIEVVPSSLVIPRLSNDLNLSALATELSAFQEEAKTLLDLVQNDTPGYLLVAMAGNAESIVAGLADAQDRPNAMREDDPNTQRFCARHLDPFMSQAGQLLIHAGPLRARSEVGAFERAEQTIEKLVGADHAKSLKEMADSAANATKAVTDAAVDAAAKVKTIEDLVQQAGTAKFARDFGAQAEAHKNSADKWGWFTLAAAVLVVVVVFVFGYTGWPLEPTGNAPWEIAQRLSIRVLLISLLVSALVWTSRIYRAHKHSEYVNTHRKHALLTFTTLRDAIDKDDRDTRNAVVLKAMEAIFTPQPTGFLPAEPEPSPTSTAVDLIEKLTKKSS